MGSGVNTMAGAHALGHKLIEILKRVSPSVCPCVLLAEDDGEIRELLASELRRDGYRVLEAESGGQLLDFLRAARRAPGRASRPDVLVTDHRMPGCDGMDVLDELRRDDWEMPVILITGFGDADLRARARRLGVSAVFDKPFNVDDLRVAVLCLAKPREGGPGEWLAASGAGLGE